ncbi:MAG: polymer-forming cytoskeletal protein [Verrucomicrobiota bacterium]
MECPHCGFKQQEYAAAKSTMCRQCGAHFSPSMPREEAGAPAPRRGLPEINLGSSAGALLKQFDGLWKSNRTTVVECLDCHRTQEVSGVATSTICPQCSAHIDLQDYKIATSFSRSIRTTGEVHVTSRGDLNSSNVFCRKALIQGKLRGNLHCTESAVIDCIGKIPGRVAAREVTIERKAQAQFFRRLRVTNVEIRGHMIGEIIAEGLVTIRKHGTLDGNVTAKAINVEKGGLFTGQLVIGQADLHQGELLPAVAGEPASDAALPLANPVPVV